MLYQVLAPLTRRTGHREHLCGVGAPAERDLFGMMGSNARSRRFPESDRATAPPIPKNSKDATWRLAIDVRWGTRESGVPPTGC